MICYTKIAGTPVITGLYTMLIPTTLFALFGSSRHLVVGADSATAAILAAKLKAKGIRLVVAHEMEELKTHTHDRLGELFGEDAFYDRLKDVVTQYRQKFNIAAPSRRPDQTPET